MKKKPAEGVVGPSQGDLKGSQEGQRVSRGVYGPARGAKGQPGGLWAGQGV